MENLQLANKLGSSLNSGSISVNHFQMLMDKIKKNYEDMQQGLDKLEGDVAAGQDNVIQIVRLKAECSYTFWIKGHKEKY